MEVFNVNMLHGRKDNSMLAKPLPPNKHTRVPYGDNIGIYVVPIWVSPAGCVVRLLKVFYWNLYGAHQMAHKKNPDGYPVCLLMVFQ